MDDMFSIIGIVVVVGAVLGGFVMAGGPLPVLIQPNELIVIGGAAIGTLIIGAPGKFRSRLIGAFKKSFTGTLPTKSDYLDILKMQFEVATFIRRNGAIALENHLTDLKQSDIFKKYSSFLHHHHAVDFYRDALRQVVNGVSVEDLMMLLDSELEVHHTEEHLPIGLIKTVGDALPGLGIVAAVLGIVITMGHLDGGAEEIGHHVAAALVGTFLGILICYGMLQPLATNLELQGVAFGRYMACLKEGLLASMRGASPAFAVEFARKSIFSDERPTSEETEAACKEVKSGGAAQAAAA
jgi:chemotaxis protein MotA